MKNTFQYIVLVLFFLVGFFGEIQSQNYIRLDDASGMNTDSYQTQLQAAADSLLSVIPTPQKDSIRVYDFGFYLHHETMSGGFPDVMQRMIDERDQDPDHPYYVLFGKQTDQTGIYTKLWVEIKLPATGKFECLDLVTVDYRSQLYTRIRVETEMTYSNYQNDPSHYADAEIAAMLELKAKLAQLFDCCDPSPSLRSSTGCVLCPTNDVDVIQQMIENGFAIQAVKIIDDPDDTPAATGGEGTSSRSSTNILNATVEINDATIVLDDFLNQLQSSYQAYVQGYLGETINVNINGYKYPRDCAISEFNTAFENFQLEAGDIRLYATLVNLLNGEGVLGWRIEGAGDFSENDLIEGSFNAHYINLSIKDELIESGLASKVDLVGNVFKSYVLDDNCEELTSLSSLCEGYDATRNKDNPITSSYNLFQVDFNTLNNNVVFNDYSSRIEAQIFSICNLILGTTSADENYQYGRKKYLVMSMLKDYKCIQGTNETDFNYTHFNLFKQTFSPVEGAGILDGIDIRDIRAYGGERTYVLDASTLKDSSFVASFPPSTAYLVKLDESVVVGSDVQIFIKNETQQTDLKGIFESTLNSNTILQENISALSNLDVCNSIGNNNIIPVLSAIETAPACVISQLDNFDRISLINCIVDNWLEIGSLPTNFDATRELALTKLFEDIGDPEGFVCLAEQELHVHNFLIRFENITVLKRLLANLIKISVDAGYINNISPSVSNNETPPISLVHSFSQTDERRIKWQAVTNVSLPNGKTGFGVNLSYDVCNFVGITTAQYLGSACPTEEIGTFRLFSQPIDLISEVKINGIGINGSTDSGAKIGNVPAIVVPLLINQYDNERFYKEIIGTVNVAAVAFGAAQIRSGLSLWSQGQQLQGIKHVGLGVLDVGATFVSLHCDDSNNSGDALCQVWKDYGFWFSIGLVGANFINLPQFADDAAELAVTARRISTLKSGRLDAYPSIKNFYYRFQRGGFIPDDALTGILKKIDEDWPATKLQALNDDLALNNFALFNHLEEFPGQLKAWKMLDDAGDVLSPLKTNVAFLQRLDANPKLINQLNSFDDVGKAGIVNNIDEFLKGVDVRPHIIAGSVGVDDAIAVLGGVRQSPSPGGYINSIDPNNADEVLAAQKYIAIANNPNQINLIATNLAEHITNSANPSPSLINKLTTVVTDARKHIFMDEHLVEKTSGVFVYGRFDPRLDIANKWNAVSSNLFDFEDAEGLLVLLRHEYVESKMMAEGMIYARLNPGAQTASAFRFGAHDLSPLDFLDPQLNQVPQFDHWSTTMNRSFIPSSINNDFSNIDDVITTIKTVNGF